MDVEKRSVNLSIKGNDFIIYNEQTSNSIEFDSNPLFKKTTIDMYGCMWNFNIWSSKSFRTQNQSSQALIILVRGIFIDTWRLTLFILLAKSNRHAIEYAGKVAKGYQKSAEDLEDANDELEGFADRTSHDLRSSLTSAIGLL